LPKTEGRNATGGQQARLRVPRALSKSLARVGISKPVAHSRNASATGGLPTVLLPWNLGSYEPMNNFHPLFRKWVQAQTSVRFVRPPWAKELCQSPRYREDCSNTQYLEHGFGRVFEFEKAREFFSIQEFIFSSRLSAAAEFHHTIPFTTAKRPFFFHCESIPPVFMPMGFQGQEFDSELISNILPIYREIFESDHCLGIFSHLKSTIAEFAATFQLDKIRRKLRYLPLAADMYIRKARSDETPIFIFNNSAHQDPNSLVLRGGVFAIQILDIVRRERPGAKLLFVGSHAQRLFSEPWGLGESILKHENVREILYRNRDNIIWISGWLSEHTLDRLFASAHFFLLPSIDLHTSSVLRAMGQGCIPIVSNAYGISELISQRRNGIILNILDSSVSKMTEFGFTNTDHDAFISRFNELRDRLSREIRQHLDILVEPRSWFQLFQTMNEEFDRRFGRPVDTKFLAKPLQEDRRGVDTSGDLRGFTRDVSRDDFKRVGRQELPRIGNVRVVRYGPNVLSFDDGAVADRRVSSLEWSLNSKSKLVHCWSSFSQAAAALANQRADIPHHTRTLLSPHLEADSMNKAEITIKEVVETQESWFFTLEASMGELRSQLRRVESSLVETIGQRLSSLERTMDERTQRLLSLETVLREWSSRLLSLESMAEGRSNDLHDLRNVVQHESATRIQHIDQVNNALEDVRKTGESMLYSIAILGRGLEDIYYEQLFEKRLLLLEASSRLAKGT
jgi:glycosyltransferase involved in cell wall biosynthesis